MDNLQRIQQLTDEILNIIPQYEAEVSGGRKKWPASIKKRILELCQLGVGPGKIEKITGIAYTTQLKWRKEANLPVRDLRRGKKKNFHEVSLVPTTVVGSAKPTTVITSKVTTETIKITTPEGVTIEFTDPKLALKLFKSLRGA